jgi:hypothetical protein
MSNMTGASVLTWIFALAALFALWNWRLRASATRRLLALGFETCPGEEAALAATLSALCAATGTRMQVRVTSALRRTAGAGALHHFDVHDETPRDTAHSDRGHVSPSWPAYLLDLRDASTLHRAPVAIHLAKSDSRVFREVLRNLISLSERGAELERSPHAWSANVIAAYGAVPAKIDDVVPPALQEKIVRAAEHGFDAVHLANGKAAFCVLPGKRDVEREWAYLSQWC